MTKKKIGLMIGIVAAIIVLLIGGCMAYDYLFQDLSGMTTAEIEAFKKENPYVQVSYTVTIEGDSVNVIVDQNTTAVYLEETAQLTGMIAQADYLQHLEAIHLGDIALTGTALSQLQDAFPNCLIEYKYITILGIDYALDTTEVDLAGMTSEQVDDVIRDIKQLSNLQAINLIDADGNASLSLDDAVKLYTAFPDVQFSYAVDLFGQHVTTDMESLEYFKVNIGDEGLKELRKLLPMMYNLTYLKLDTCKTTDEAMAQLREDFPDIEVHWRIFYSVFNCMTDNYKMWTIGGLMDKQITNFIHLRGIKYLDLGHNFFTHLDFMENLTDVEVAILAIGQLEDISGIKNCTKLTYLEIFSNRKLDNEDMQNLSGLVNMEYLNISNIPNMTDLSFTDNMTKLKKLWCTLSKVPQEEIDRVKALHPDCEFVFLPDGDPTNYGWRTNPDGSYTARYALLREQIGYDRDDVSQYPKGELKEEITYESTGITPDD